jgi:hypothetical protein
MSKRGFVCGAAVSAVLLVSGAAFSGGQTTSVDQLLDFDRATGELWASPPGRSVAIYQHSVNTRHLVADLSRFLPPDPCTPLARVWNIAVAHEERTGRVNPVHFEVLLELMSRFQCSATITTTTTTTTNTSTAPQPLLSIAPSGT